MSFKEFLETSLEHVPTEFERNFNLVRELDERTVTLIKDLNKAVKQYKEASLISERKSIKQRIDRTNEKLLGLADDKIALVEETYNLVDKNIEQLLKTTEPNSLIGYEMPLSQFEPIYCICKGVSHGQMIACENKDCPIEWFHFGCVGLLESPKGKWYCQDCLRQAKKPRRRKSKKYY